MHALGKLMVAFRKYDDKQHGARNGVSETDNLVKKGYQATGTAQSPLAHGSFYVHGSNFNIRITTLNSHRKIMWQTAQLKTGKFIKKKKKMTSRSRRPCGLRRGAAAPSCLELRVRNPLRR